MGRETSNNNGYSAKMTPKLNYTRKLDSLKFCQNWKFQFEFGKIQICQVF